MNFHTTPIFPRCKSDLAIIISLPSRDHRDRMSPLHQFRRQLAQVLARSHDVGIKGLIEQENFHLTATRLCELILEGLNGMSPFRLASESVQTSEAAGSV